MDGGSHSVAFACRNLATNHGPKRSISGLPGELPQQSFRLASHIVAGASAPAAWDALTSARFEEAA